MRARIGTALTVATGSRGRASRPRSASRRSSSAACPTPRRPRRGTRARARRAARRRRARRRARGSAPRAGRAACAPGGRSPAASRPPRGSRAPARPGSRSRARSSSRAHSSAVPRITGPQPRIPAATAPCSESGSAASVIRAATFVGIIPCSAIATSSRSRKYALLLGRLLAGEQQVEVLREAQPAHQVAGEVAAADLDPVGVGLADVADGVSGLTDHAARPTLWEGGCAVKGVSGPTPLGAVRRLVARRDVG